MDPQSKRVVEEFRYLLEKSQQLFAGLRDLPPTGNAKLWQPFFHRAFDIYTKLWKFQQTNRSILEDPNIYGLKRYDIGEIASKIGQLYYHYYLRTSETDYLKESMIFYNAVRDRAYFKNVLETKMPNLVVKALRYYARHIVVALLLSEETIMNSLIGEFKFLVEEYGRVFQPGDYTEWTTVLQDMNNFQTLKKAYFTVDNTGNLIIPQIRLKSDDGIDRKSKFKIKEAIIVGNSPSQPKLSELTLDMYFMLQVLERSSEKTKQPGEDKSSRENPRKTLLYRPSIDQFLLYLATCSREVGEDNEGLLLYISCPGKSILFPENSDPKNISSSLMIGSKSEDENPKSSCCLFTTDLVPFTRKPMFLIIEATNAAGFSQMVSSHHAPFLSVIAPSDTPPGMDGIFTLFLASPLLSILKICNRKEISMSDWKQLEEIAQRLENSISYILSCSEYLDESIGIFLEDFHCSKLLARFVLCCLVFSQHVELSKTMPMSNPPIIASKIVTPEIYSSLRTLLDVLQTPHLFQFS